MAFYADLHIHSKYSRATSKSCDLENLAYWARKKGIAVVGTGDFTHPAWRTELREKLVPAEAGLFRLRDDLERMVERRVSIPGQCATRFLLSVEISTIYKKGDRTRKIHHLVYAPDFDSVERMVRRLSRIGNLNADGRPILGLDSRDLLEIVLEASEHGYVVPAHAWTPWFAVLGSRSGFDDVADCYGDLAEHIFAIETGLSSDPPMNWRLSRLDRYTLMSSSDAHSPAKLGREACLFETDMDYFAMRRALETREGYGGTVEFFPEEGKYHMDGHRKCGVVLDPDETRALGGQCPVCQKPLTVGVLHRVQSLADRPVGFRPEGAVPFRNLVPLPEVIAEIAGTSTSSKTVSRDYEGLLSRLGSELFILEQAPIEDIRRCGSAQIAEAIDRMRAGKVICQPGFDGEYGVIRLFEDRELRRQKDVSMRLRLSEGEGELHLPSSSNNQKGQNGGPSDGDPLASGSPSPPSSSPPRAGVAPARASTSAAEPAASEAANEIDEAATGKLLALLDPEQCAAAEQVDGPLLIIAGPGTGKTRTLTHRIAHLVTAHGIEPEACLAITFTNRAAEEMRERLHAILRSVSRAEAGERIWVKTFHGLALAILQEHREIAGLHRGFRVADEAERIALIANALVCSRRKARSVLARVSGHKRARAVHHLSEAPDDDLMRVMVTYQASLEAASLVDFDDLLLRAVDLLESEPAVRDAYRRRFQYISVDEYQDIDELQYRLVKLMCQPGGPEAPDSDESGPRDRGTRSLCVIGDPDQAIYGFRGADVGFFLRFREDFPDAREVRLTRNYRSTRTIVDAALQAIAPTSLVRGRVLYAQSDDRIHGQTGGQTEDANRIVMVETASEQAEAELVVHTIEALVGGTSFFSLDSGRVGHGGEADLGFSDFAVLYRTDMQVLALSMAFERAGIPFQKRSHDRLSDRAVIQDLLEIVRETSVRDDGRAATPSAASLPAAMSIGRPSIQALLRGAAAVLLARSEERDWDCVGEVQVPPRDSPEYRQPYHQDDLDEALEILAPLAERCGTDVERFLTEIVLDTEVDVWDPRADQVSMLTLHASKGLEFRVVFLVGCEDGILPLRWGHDVSNDASGEERRLFFVGMTRAREQLYLTRARRRMWRGKIREQEISPFVRDIEDELLARQVLRVNRKTRREQLGLF